ncbi:hypothetical protein MUB24_04460 [Lederbergia sp. NSJ-179]|uniref:hypothetical protein n=1 Tax=Lederbergia sp. NSJ-179 TaxID=2931402 RepID=UPI001FD5074F|nr:hypothetical protein [Lederbergia sp. NSJ-179]MCJ7840175.1 hypothetical protein [Lederbergia sp. NSJ-179]
MNNVKKCLALTEQIIVLVKITNDDQREPIIERIEDLLSQRSALFAELRAPYTMEEQKMGKELLALDQEMNAALNHFLKTIQTDMQTLERKKKSAAHYSNPYAATDGLDGMFYDRRQ